MSSFLLCWHRHGDAIPAQVAACAEAHRIVGRETPPRRVVDGSVGAWHWESDWAPGAERALPIVDADWSLAATLRLDARTSLAARLRDRGFDVDAADDALLAIASFHAWGDDAPAHWIGDYAFAAVAPARDRLIVARGVTGVRACFALWGGAWHCVSDDLGLLVRIAGGRKAPVERAVAEYLRHGQLVSQRLTFHERIERIPAAHTLVIGADGRTQLRRHWEHPAPEVREGRRDDEVIDEFRELLGTAIADRLRGPRAAVLLSGGLDSPALAVEALRAAPAVRLEAVTASWTRLLDDPEPEFARSVASMLSLTHRVHEYAADDGFPGDASFESPEPMPDVEPTLWRAQAARLASIAPVVLNGEDVDALLTPPTLFEQIKQGGVSATVAAWEAYRRETGVRPWAGVRRTLRDALGGGSDAAPAPRWLRDGIAVRGLAPSEEAPRHATRPDAVSKLVQPTWDATCWLDDPVMSGADLVVLLPFMDPRVIAFCFALPPVPWLQRKQLLRRAYRGLLPDAVLTRPKTPVRGYYQKRVERWRQDGSRAALAAPVEEWVDLTAWRETLANATDPDDVYAAWRVCELSRWLAQPAD